MREMEDKFERLCLYKSDVSTTKNSVLHHVLYEIQMLLAVLHCQSKELLVTNLLVETYFLHLRNLLEFFANKRKFRTDIIVSDIVENADSLAIESSTKNELLRLISQTLSHLSLNRCKEDISLDL